MFIIFSLYFAFTIFSPFFSLSQIQIMCPIFVHKLCVQKIVHKLCSHMVYIYFFITFIYIIYFSWFMKYVKKNFLRTGYVHTLYSLVMWKNCLHHSMFIGYTEKFIHKIFASKFLECKFICMYKFWLGKYAHALPRIKLVSIIDV